MKAAEGPSAAVEAVQFSNRCWGVKTQHDDFKTLIATSVAVVLTASFTSIEKGRAPAWQLLAKCPGQAVAAFCIVSHNNIFTGYQSFCLEARGTTARTPTGPMTGSLINAALAFNHRSSY
jgi:hypothetical protein